MGELIGYCGFVYGGDGVGDELEFVFELFCIEYNWGYVIEVV